MDTSSTPAEDPSSTADLAEARARIHLCGPLSVALGGQRIEEQLPGRQGRLVFAYLIVNRGRPVSRDELVGVLWPHDPPAVPESSLRPLLTRLRRALGEERLVGRAQLAVDLGAEPWIDVEVARSAADRAEAALDAGRAADALAIATEALAVIERPFLPETLVSWAEEQRQELATLEPPLLEVAGRAALELGAAHRGEAERLARRLVEHEPFRESGHALLMEILARYGNIAEALRVFDGLRVRLRDELGLSPAPALAALYERLLRQEGGPSEPVAEPPTTATLTATPVEAAAPPTPVRPELPPRLAAAASGAFVGRGAALAQLERSWERALTGSEQLAFVAGEPGVGKTRLVSELAARAYAGGATVLYGRCDEEVLMPYQPVVEALRGALRDGQDLGLPDELAVELARLIPELGLPTGAAGAGPGGVSTADAPGTRDGLAAREPLLGERDTQRYRLFEAVATALAALSGERGLLLVLDDLHWADRTTLLLLRFLARIDGTGRVLLVATYRDDEVGDSHPLSDLLADVWRDRRFERVPLEGLDETETAALVATKVEADTTSSFVRRLVTQTSGNPFFIEETIRGLRPAARESACLDEDELIATGVPEGVGDVIVRRLGTVGEDVREVLGVAAVVGREFDLDVVAAALGRSEDDVLDAVEHAMAARLVVEAPAQVDRFTFCHALVRRTLYDRQAASRRLRRHLRVGEALEQRRAGRFRRAPSAAELARHFMEARPLAGIERALEHVLAAADEAAEKLAYDEAAEHLTWALALLDEAESDDDAKRARTLLALGRVLWRAGDSSARKRYREAAEIARRARLPEELARAVLGMTGRFYEAGVADPSIIGLLEETLAMLPEEDSTLRARLLARLTDGLHVASDEQRRGETSAEAVAMARRLGDEDTLTVALLARHGALLHPEHLDERLQIAGEELELARRRMRPELLALGLHWRIFDHLEEGDGAAARADEQELSEVAADLRQPLYRYLDRCWQGVWAQIEGRVDDADAISADAFAMGRRAGARTAGSTRMGALVTIRRDQGRMGELVDEVRGIVREHPQITTWRGLQPLVLVEAGEEDAARTELDALEAEGFERLPRDLFWLTTVLVLGEAAASVGSASQQQALYGLLAPYAHRCVPASLAACWGAADRVV
ncbi:MAG TPA: AAA family ATPase, partial [Solirubrobacteraceae bacterium]|nr:AAA family ATPase [Solirubrobacteraceae bacterium]